MKTIQFSLILICWSVFSIKHVSDNNFLDSLSLKTESSAMTDEFCGINIQYDSLVRQGISNVLMYKELNTPSGNKGLIIWKENNCIYGVTILESTVGVCSKQVIEPTNQNLGLIALKFFYDEEKKYSVTKSKIEFMHDYSIQIRALINGKEMKSDFLHSSARNKGEFLPEIARLCQNIIYKW